MSNEFDVTSEPNPPLIYQIRVKSHLTSAWTGWFEGLKVTLEDNGETLLTGPVVDQAALHGLLKKVRDLAIPLISVNPVQCHEADLERGSEKWGQPKQENLK